MHSSLVRSLNYVCLHPGCNTTCPSEAALKDHITTSHQPSASTAPLLINSAEKPKVHDITGVHGPSNGLDTALTGITSFTTFLDSNCVEANLLPRSTVGLGASASRSIDGTISSGLNYHDATRISTNPYPIYQPGIPGFSAFGALNTNSIGPWSPISDLTQTTPFPFNWNTDISDSHPERFQDVAIFSPTPFRDTNSATPAPKISCTDPTCSKSFTRRTDMVRHARKHNFSAQKFPCTAAGCQYVGNQGFLRKDKLRDHVRSVHGGGM